MPMATGPVGCKVATNFDNQLGPIVERSILNVVYTSESDLNLFDSIRIDSNHHHRHSVIVRVDRAFYGTRTPRDAGRPPTVLVQPFDCRQNFW